MKKEAPDGKKTIRPYMSALRVLIAAALIILASTMVFTRYVRKESEATTVSLSRFYLEEMAERTVYEINTVLENNTAQLQRAVDGLNADNLKTIDDLKDYLGTVQRLSGLKIVAVVDEDGMVYTSETSFSGISRFGFLSEPITETKLFTTRTSQSTAMVLAAMPTAERLPFGDTHIVACITGVDVDTIISARQLQGANNQVLCRLFDGDDGVCIVESEGRYADGSSIFDAWENDCRFSDEFPLEQLIGDWKNHTEGYSSYISPEGTAYLYYKPVPGTDWMVSVRLYEGVISQQIVSANDHLLHSSWMLLLIVLFSMLTVLLYIIKRDRKIQAQQFKREKEEELLRQEAKATEEKLRLQEKLLEEEKASHRQASVLQILSQQYASVFYIDLDEGMLMPIRLTEYARDRYHLKVNTVSSSEAFFADYLRDVPDAEEAAVVRQYSDPAYLRRELAGNSVCVYRFRIIKEGKELYSQIRAARVGESEKIRHVVLGFAIVDEAVRAEQEQQRILREALAQAEAANRAKTVFLNNMSHDIRTPMNAIIGFTDLALKKETSPEVRDWLEKIDESSRHLLTLINDVLDISRIESGKIQIEPVPVNITKVNDSVLDVMNGFLAGRKLNFQVLRTPAEDPYLLADEIRIREILVNILSNAVKFTPDGGTITFEAALFGGEDDRHERLHYRISDTGIGMSPEFVKKMFDEFAQEDSGARTQYKGTGLGMTITKRYVEMMGGTIRVESEKGKGTSFTVELPLERAEKIPESRKSDSGRSDLNGMKLLLAEDNELNAEIAQMLLTEAGAELTVVRDGKQAVDAFAQSPAGRFDVILMDVMMPVMDGLTATRTIRALNRPDAKTIPIIAMTANAFAEDAQKCLNAGMNAHLAKPLDVHKLLSMVAQYGR